MSINDEVNGMQGQDNEQRLFLRSDHQILGFMLVRIVSGGQTGVDRGALDAAIAAGLSHGGWCPKGRRAEDGCIPEYYALEETPSARYAERTAGNVKDSDGTLVLATGPLKGGTRLTVEFARKYGRPCMIVDPDGTLKAEEVAVWIERCGIRVLNIAGPRESAAPGIGFDARRFVGKVIDYDRQRTPEGS